jgi:energy-converting hydrogenase Eha subunit A
MKPTLNDKLIASLTLISGLAISGVAEYYSIMGLIAIYPAALIPIIVMGVVLGLGKISGTVWLKQNWEWSPFFLKAYVLPAIIALMMITSLGVFGFLSKAHSDQSLVSGDVQAKIAVYDEKIKTAKENIDADRKQLKQMDEAVDQIMGRSSDEKGADKANAVRKAQQRDRSALAKDIETNQKLVASLNNEAAPIRAEIRKVEAEVGPIKYIAHLLYGENPDANVLEKAVIWVTVLIVIVLDPLAVVLLLASQYSFQRFREQDEDQEIKDWFEQGKERARQLDKELDAEGDSPQGPVVDVVSPDTTATNHAGFIAQEVSAIIPEAVTTDFEGIRVAGSDWVQTGPEFEILKKTPTVEYKILEDVSDEEYSYIPKDISSIEEDEAFAAIEKANADRSKYQIIPDLIKDEPAIVPPTPITKSERPLRTKIFKRPEPVNSAIVETPVVLTTVTEETVQQVLVEPTQTKMHNIADGEYIHIDGQTYHKNSIPQGILDSYVQNEEQQDSNLWSLTKKE